MPARRLVALVLFLLPALAHAHQASVTYSTVDVEHDGKVAWALRISTRDLYEALGLERDRDATDAEVRAGEKRLYEYVFKRLAVLADDKPCPISAPSLDILTQTQRFAEIRFTAACPVPLSKLTLTYDLFFELDPRHTGMLSITHGERTVTAELSHGMDRFEWNLDLRPPEGLTAAAYVWKGMEHIYSGYDHIAFIVGLVLIAAVRAREGGGTVSRPPAEAVPYVLKVVTAFTVAHSITLILAALDVVTLPRRLVESAIAASIVYIAVENIAVRDPRGRWPLAFCFGLVHGLGFAAMLRPLLPGKAVLVPLLLFNVGVELGQLSIVVPLGAILWFVGRADPTRYRRNVVLGGSAVIGLLGLLWLIERVADINIITKYMG